MEAGPALKTRAGQAPGCCEQLVEGAPEPEVSPSPELAPVLATSSPLRSRPTPPPHGMRAAHMVHGAADLEPIPGLGAL